LRHQRRHYPEKSAFDSFWRSNAMRLLSDKKVLQRVKQHILLTDF